MTNDLQKMLESIAMAFSRTDSRTFWPISASQIVTNFDFIDTLEVWDSIKDLSIPKISEFILNASTIRHSFNSLWLVGLKINRIERKMNNQEINTFLKTWIKVLKNKTGRNWHAINNTKEKQIEKEVKRIKLKNAEEEKDELAQLILSIDSYARAFYYDVFRTAGLNISGPYKINGKQVIVYHLYRANPRDLWGKNTKIKEVKLFISYKMNKLKIDWLGHVISKARLSDKVAGFSILINDYETNDINTLIRKLNRISAKQYEFVEKMNTKKKIVKGAEISRYLLKEFREEYCGSWKLSTEIKKAIDATWKKYYEKFKPTKVNIEKSNQRTIELLLNPFKPFPRY